MCLRQQQFWFWEGKGGYYKSPGRVCLWIFCSSHTVKWEFGKIVSNCGAAINRNTFNEKRGCKNLANLTEVDRISIWTRWYFTTGEKFNRSEYGCSRVRLFHNSGIQVGTLFIVINCTKILMLTYRYDLQRNILIVQTCILNVQWKHPFRDPRNPNKWF